jgi:transposase
MRETKLLRRLLGVREMFAEEVRLGTERMIVAVRPRWYHPRCGRCCCRCPDYDRRAARLRRHVALLKIRVWLEYAPRRVNCPQCGVRTEAVPWAEVGNRFTTIFEELVAYLDQVTDRTHVSRFAGIAWASVGSIAERVVARCHDEARFEGLRRIGIDEFSYRKHHRDLTTVVDHDRRRVVWAGKGRSAEALDPFFEDLGPETCAKIEVVTIDMAPGYINAVDEVRREIQRATKGTEDEKALRKSRYAHLKSP